MVVAMKCMNCGNDTTNPRFCNRSCAAKYNNRGIVRNGNESPYCKVCGTKCEKSTAIYCSHACRVTDATITAIQNGTASAKTVKRYLMEQNRQCSICGLREWMGHPIPLIIDHIDGNSDNNSLTNLRLVCGNCDMQLPTYKSKNKGNGRAFRRQRYKDGKSY